MPMRSWSRFNAAGVVVLGVLAGCGDDNGQAANENSPGAAPANIIVILADDLGLADISTYGLDRIPTPHIDALAADGVLFTHGYVSAPVCSPSRAALLTGRYQNRFGFEYNVGEGGNENPNIGLDANEITLAQALKSAGYATGLIGKWHLGGADPFYPTNRGFDEFYGFIAGATAYIDPAHPEAIAAGEGEWWASGFTRSKTTRMFEGSERKTVDNFNVYLTDDFANRAADFIVRHTYEPFFLYVAFNAPHTPLQVTKKYYDRFPQIADHKMRVYAGMISALDDGVGQILATLEKQGLADKTLVVFLSDNGCATYTGLCTCEPLRGGKISLYEGGVRIPFMMRWPGKIPAGLVYSEPVVSRDIFPTALSAAHMSLPADRVYDGVNLMPYLAKERKEAAHPELHWMRRPHQSLRDGDWKIWTTDDGKVEFLFNLAEDPNERNNLFSREPAKVAELKAKMKAFREQVPVQAWPSRADLTLDFCGTEITVPR
jgi:arylsulfatase A-like enzyme